MKKIFSYLLIFFSMVLCFSFYPKSTLTFTYEPAKPRLYFWVDSILIETDTASLMPLIRENYPLKRAEQILTEINYRIKNPINDSIKMDGSTLHLYLNAARTSYEAAAINHGEVRTLIKKKLVKIYYKNTKQIIKEITIKKEGSKRKCNIDEVYSDKKNNKEILRINIYLKQY